MGVKNLGRCNSCAVRFQSALAGSMVENRRAQALGENLPSQPSPSGKPDCKCSRFPVKICISSEGR